MQYPSLPGYTVTGILGQGAMGCVYRGRHDDGQEVAIKTILVEDPSLQRALANEWEVLQRVEHPLLINERELISLNSNLYLVMEFVESQNLADWIAVTARSQREQEAPQILAQVVEVLTYLHGQDPPVIVRDLKPDNILLCPDGTLRLIDFGIARALEGSAKTEVALKGFASAAYSPLEQYSAQSTTSTASDVYSLGATAYHLLTGKKPESAIDMLTHGQTPEKMLQNQGVSAAWTSLIGSAMKGKAQHRISLQEFSERLKTIQASAQEPRPESPRIHLADPAPQLERKSYLSQIVLLCLLLLASALLLLMGNP
jgi:serine/threonine protein kinase